MFMHCVWNRAHKLVYLSGEGVGVATLHVHRNSFTQNKHK